MLRKNNFIYSIKKKYTNEVLHKVKRKQKKGDKNKMRKAQQRKEIQNKTKRNNINSISYYNFVLL